MSNTIELILFSVCPCSGFNKSVLEFFVYFLTTFSFFLRYAYILVLLKQLKIAETTTGLRIVAKH